MICLACRRLQNDYYSLITYNNHFNDNLLQRAMIIVIYVFLCVFMCFYVFLCVFMCFVLNFSLGSFRFCHFDFRQ